MPNVQALTKALAILSAHGVEVEKVPGWETRDGSRTRDLRPEAVVVHHTGDVSTPLSMIRDGRSNLPGPLANFLVGQSGRIYLVAAGYSNNAGYGGEANFLIAKAGKATAQMKPPTSDGSWSANSHAWSIEADGTGDWPAIVRQHVVEVCAALHMAEGWTNGARVIAHKELTRRKPGDPGDDMGDVRADVLAKIAEWSGQAEPMPDPTPTPPPSTADFKVGQINLELWGGTQTTASFDARGKWLHDKMRCSVYLLCETSPALPSFPGDMRARLLALLGGSWKVEAWQELAVAYDGAKWRIGGTPRIAKYGVYQGALLVPLVHIDTGIGVDMVSVHVRPGKVATDAEKRAEIRAAFGLAKGWPVVIGGDWNTSAVRDMLPPGFVAATPDVQTQAAGRLDHVFVRSGTTGTVAVRTAIQKDPGALSDHLGWVVGVSITNQPSTL